MRLLIALLLLVAVVIGFVPSTSPRYARRTAFHDSSKPATSSKVEEEEERFGVSYIGQDVCGSKYNDDPFGEAKDKPDAWSWMKARIRKEEERLANETKSTLYSEKQKHPGQWP